MPNRMFDTVSNPFVVQNLLSGEAETSEPTAFRPNTDSSPKAPFIVNRLVHEDTSLDSFTPDAGSAAPDTSSAQAAHTLRTPPYAEAGFGERGAGLGGQLGEDLMAQLSAELNDALAETAAAPEAGPEPDHPITALEAGHTMGAEPLPQTEPDLSSQAVTSLIAAAREEGRTAGHQEGLTAGYAKASADLQQAHTDVLTAEQAALRVLCEGVQQLANDGDALFEPLKRLSLHLAEQLVRGELSLSGHAISRLVDNCVREMTGSGEKTLQVQLHPEDLEQYRPLVAQHGQAMRLLANPALKRGSVRVSLESTVVEDLIEHRLEALAKTLTQPVSGGGSGRSPLSARLGVGEGRQSVEDVRSRPVAPEASPAAQHSSAQPLAQALTPVAEPVNAYASDGGDV